MLSCLWHLAFVPKTWKFSSSYFFWGGTSRANCSIPPLKRNHVWYPWCHHFILPHQHPQIGLVIVTHLLPMIIPLLASAPRSFYRFSPFLTKYPDWSSDGQVWAWQSLAIVPFLKLCLVWAWKNLAIVPLIKPRRGGIYYRAISPTFPNIGLGGISHDAIPPTLPYWMGTACQWICSGIPTPKYPRRIEYDQNLPLRMAIPSFFQRFIHLFVTNLLLTVYQLNFKKETFHL